MDQGGAGLAVGGGSFAFFVGNLQLAQRGATPDPVTIALNETQRIDLSALLRRFTWPVAILFSLPTAAAASVAWLTAQRFLHGTPFDVTDPVFGRDVGYYVFTMPFIAWILGLVFTLTLLALLVTVPVYAMRRDIVLWQRRVTIEPSAALHLGALTAALFAVLGARAFLVDLPSLRYSTTGPLVGASFADMAVGVPPRCASPVSQPC